MSEIHERIEQGKNWLEKAVEGLPGYQGYKDKELRREADRLQREAVAEKLETGRRALEELALAMTNAGRLELLDEIGTIGRKLIRVRDRYLFAPHGYAGLFDAVKVDEAVLDRVYELDVRARESAGAVEQLVDELAADSPSLKADLALLERRVQETETLLQERDAILTGVK